MPKPTPIDERRELVVPGDKEATINYCVKHIIEAAESAIKDHGFFSIALSGGSTPKAIYQKLTQAENIARIDWEKVFVFFSDERSVAPDDPDSNYKMAIDNGFSQIPIPKSRIHRMVAERDIENNARAYERLIDETLQGRPFDYIMLGMGDDGHTASLFPGTSALQEREKKVVPNQVVQKKTWRMTFTYPLINAAKHIALYVLGEGKVPMLTQVLKEKDPNKLPPSGLVGTPQSRALWIADNAAAANFIK